MIAPGYHRFVSEVRSDAIIFAREPILGRAKTRLIPVLGAKNAAALADAFIRDALRKARGLEPRQIVIAGDAPGGAARSRYFRRLSREFGARLVDQGTGDLGARMARVLGMVKGTYGAILFGTDTPSIPAAMLKQSADLLERFAVVIAPALDGGYYLLGVREELPDIFTDIRWGSESVMRETLRQLRAGDADYALGRWWYDVDRAGDLTVLCRHLEGRAGAAFARALPLGREVPCPTTAALLARLGLCSRLPPPRTAGRGTSRAVRPGP